MVKKRAIIVLELAFLLIFSLFFVSAFSISVQSPLNQNYSTKNINLSLTVQITPADEGSVACIYNINSTENKNLPNLTPANDSFGFLSNFDEGEYTVLFSCSNATEIAAGIIKSDEVSFIVDQCVPDWRQANISCLPSDYLIASYIDLNIVSGKTCFERTGLSTDTRASENLYCDYCIPKWSCSEFNQCKKDDKSYCINATDSNLTSSKTCYEQTNNITDLYIGNASTDFSHQSCDFCVPIWNLGNTSCDINDKIFQTASDSNNCHSQTNLDSDNNKPANRTYSCDYCVPEWKVYNTSCQNDEITEYYIDAKDCYAKTSLDSDLDGRKANSTYLHYCNGSVPSGSASTGSVSSSEQENSTPTLLTATEQETKKSGISGFVSRAYEDKGVSLIGEVIFIFLIIAAAIWAVFSGLRDKTKMPQIREFSSTPKNFGFK